MYSISRFQQIIKPVMNGRFARHVRKHQADKHSKGFGCQNLLLCLLYARLGRCASLRTPGQSFNAHSSHHYHLNMRSIRRSTLSEALAKRDTRPFADMLIELISLCGRTLRKQTGDLLYLLDSTPIALKGRGFDQWTGHNGRITGLKLHILMNHTDQCPVAHSITDARVNDVDERHIVQPEKGATYVFDKGYCDYNRWAQLDEAGAYFVTRLKTNAAVETVKRISPSENGSRDGCILADEYIRFTHRQNSRRPNCCHGKILRRITVSRPGKEPLVSGCVGN